MKEYTEAEIQAARENQRATDTKWLQQYESDLANIDTWKKSWSDARIKAINERFGDSWDAAVASAGPNAKKMMGLKSKADMIAGVSQTAEERAARRRAGLERQIAKTKAKMARDEGRYNRRAGLAPNQVVGTPSLSPQASGSPTTAQANREALLNAAFRPNLA